jgi:hypothetical protein
MTCYRLVNTSVFMELPFRYEMKREAVLYKYCRAAALPEILRKIKINI